MIAGELIRQALSERTTRNQGTLGILDHDGIRVAPGEKAHPDTDDETCRHGGSESPGSFAGLYPGRRLKSGTRLREIDDVRIRRTDRLACRRQQAFRNRLGEL